MTSACIIEAAGAVPTGRTGAWRAQTPVVEILADLSGDARLAARGGISVVEGHEDHSKITTAPGLPRTGRLPALLR